MGTSPEAPRPPQRHFIFFWLFKLFRQRRETRGLPQQNRPQNACGCNLLSPKKDTLNKKGGGMRPPPETPTPPQSRFRSFWLFKLFRRRRESRGPAHQNRQQNACNPNPLSPKKYKLDKKRFPKENEKKYAQTPLANPPKSVEKKSIASPSSNSWISKLFRKKENSVCKPVQEKLVNSGGDVPGSHFKIPVADMNLKNNRKACTLVSKKGPAAGGDSPDSHCKVVKVNTKPVLEKLVSSSGDSPASHCQATSAKKIARYRHAEVTNSLDVLNMPSTSSDCRFSTVAPQVVKKEISSCNIIVVYPTDLKYLKGEGSTVVSGLRRAVDRASVFERSQKIMQFFDTEDEPAAKAYLQDLLRSRFKSDVTPDFDNTHKGPNFLTDEEGSKNSFKHRVSSSSSRINKLMMSEDDMPHRPILTEPFYLSPRAKYSSPIVQMFRSDESRPNSPVVNSGLDIHHGEGNGSPSPVLDSGLDIHHGEGNSSPNLQALQDNPQCNKSQ
ncbi:uncharacterized protein [Ambystoma mexicanum]|uniref:uncharacterized protein n=1 Tax=Ambystoma mexicanum TaxID=8296 RepID=UPI0037E787F4